MLRQDTALPVGLLGTGIFRSCSEHPEPLISAAYWGIVWRRQGSLTPWPTQLTRSPNKKKNADLWLRTAIQGLPWWSSGKESAFQCRGREFDLRSHVQRGNEAHVPQLLSSCASTREPACSKLQSPRALEPAPQLERENLHVTTREKPACCNKDPVCRK